jgi:hypothetical protein
MRKNGSDPMLWVIIALVLLLLLSIAYVVSLGEFTFTKEDIDAELRRKRDDLKEQHRVLHEVIKQKEAIRDERMKWCKRVYFVARLTLVLAGAGVIYLLVFFGLIGSTFSEITAVLSAMALFIVILGFILKGKTNIQDTICLIKESFENILYGRYHDIHQEIENHYEESRVLQAQIDELEKTISGEVMPSKTV